LIIAIAVLVCVAFAGPAAGQQQITPPPPVLVTSPRVTINNAPCNHTDAHVNGDLASYTDGTTSTSVRYYRFSTGADQAIPLAPGATDSLSDVSGNKIVFTRALAGCDSIMVFDAVSLLTTEVAPGGCPVRQGVSIGSSTVAFIDYATGNGVTFAADLLGGAPTQLSSGGGIPEVSASGDTVVWEQCDSSLVNCNVKSSTRSGGVWGTATLVVQASLNPDTDGTYVVYDSSRAGSATGRDIYFQPVGGGVETQLQIAGEQSNPSLRSGVIAFESRATALSPGDIFVYVIATNMLYQVTSTPTIDDQLTDVSVLPNGDVRVVWASGDGPGGNYNLYATTFAPAPLCHYMSITPSPASVAHGGFTAITATLKACAATPQTVVIKFTLVGPPPANGCATSNTLIFATPPFTLPPGTTQTVTFPLFISRAACPGIYQLTATTSVNGTPVDTSTASLTVTP
jgi:hypothetical protein